MTLEKGSVSIQAKNGANLCALVLCLAALIYLLCGTFLRTRRAAPQFAAIPVVDGHEPLFSGSGFSKNAFFPSTSQPSFKGPLNLYGSWLGSDGTTGSVVSRWFRAAPHFK